MIHEPGRNHGRLGDERDSARLRHARPEARIDAFGGIQNADGVGADESCPHRAGRFEEFFNFKAVGERTFLLGCKEHGFGRLLGELPECGWKVLSSYAEDGKVDFVRRNSGCIRKAGTLADEAVLGIYRPQAFESR